MELEEPGGHGVFNINLERSSVFFQNFKQTKANSCVDSFPIEDYILANPEWKMDRMPEIVDGKNIADLIDSDIAEKPEAPEREEEKLQAEGFYENGFDIVCLSTSIH